MILLSQQDIIKKYNIKYNYNNIKNLRNLKMIPCRRYIKIFYWSLNHNAIYKDMLTIYAL